MRQALLLSLACLAFAQDLPEIRGTVGEYGTGTPLAGAQVTLYEFVDVDGFYGRKLVATRLTDNRGAFTFRPEREGDYFLEATKSTYLQAEELDKLGPLPCCEAAIAERGLKVGRGTPVTETRFSLIRPGALAGRVLNEDGQPVPNIRVTALAAGVPSSLGAKAETDQDGFFSFPALVPGPRVLRIGLAEERIVLTAQRFTQEAFEAADTEIETTYWPGGVTDQKLALPVEVVPGANIDVGTLRLRKAPYYRARIKYEGDCTGDWHLVFADASGYTFAPCQRDLLLEKLIPGARTLAVWTAGKYASDVVSWALVPLFIDRNNVEASLTFMPSVDLKGRVVMTNDQPLPKLDAFRLILQAVDVATGGARTNDPLSPDGTFALPHVAWPRSRMIVNLGNANVFIREIRYGGQPVQGDVITPAEGAELEIVLDDQPAIVSGVTIPGARVYAAKWPMTGARPITAVADANGAYRLPPLADGEYRIAASLRFAAEETDTRNLLSLGETIRLERGDAKTIDLKLADSR